MKKTKCKYIPQLHLGYDHDRFYREIVALLKSPPAFAFRLLIATIFEFESFDLI